MTSNNSPGRLPQPFDNTLPDWKTVKDELQAKVPWSTELALIKAKEGEQAKFLAGSRLGQLREEADKLEGAEKEQAQRLVVSGEQLKDQFHRLIDERHQLALALHQLALFAQRPDATLEHIRAAAKHGEVAAAAIVRELTPVDQQEHTTVVELRSLLADGGLNRLGRGTAIRARAAITSALALLTTAHQRFERMRHVADGFRVENARLRGEEKSGEPSGVEANPDP